MGFGNYSTSIYLNLKMMIRVGRCVISAIVGIGAVSGRLGPKDILKMLPLFVLGYTLNEAVIELKIQAFDVGGTMIIFTYASFFALTVSFILAKKIMPSTSSFESYRSSILSLLGTLLLWVCWPSFNMGLYA